MAFWDGLASQAEGGSASAGSAEPLSSRSDARASDGPNSGEDGQSGDAPSAGHSARADEGGEGGASAEDGEGNASAEAGASAAGGQPAAEGRPAAGGQHASRADGAFIRPAPEGTPYQQSISNVPQGNGEQLAADAILVAQRWVEPTRGERVKGASFDGSALIVGVDLGSISGLEASAVESRAAKRGAQIASGILALSQYGSLWDTITIDFGIVGSFTCGKRDLANDSSGWYFVVTDSLFTRGPMKSLPSYQVSAVP